MRRNYPSALVLLIVGLLASYAHAKVLPVENDKEGKYKDVKWMSPIDMKVGDAGKISWAVEVEEIVDDSTMIVSVNKYEAPVVMLFKKNGTFTKRLTRRPRNLEGHVKVWVKGYDTNNIIKYHPDGKLHIDQYDAKVIEMKETKSDDGNTIALPLLKVTKPEFNEAKPKNFDGPNKAESK